jgi:hypothetical protein
MPALGVIPMEIAELDDIFVLVIFDFPKMSKILPDASKPCETIHQH